MEIDVNNGALQVIMDSADFSINIGESAKIDAGLVIDYIKSGEAEIEAAVDNGIIEFDTNAIAETTVFNDNAVDKTTAFNNNVSVKTTDFNDNYTVKLSDFNTNATNKIGDFNDNYNTKKAVIDDAVSDAQSYAVTSKQYAIGDPSEPIGNSAKYWAEQASTTYSGLTSRVTTIEGKIPNDACTSNQLADKAYVDTADNSLQQQIDAITAASDVTDIVGTYAELQVYDTTSMPNNSIIKVLQDEGRNDETTYYRWVITGGVGAWVLIGEEGPYYTIAAADATFQEKLVSGTNIKTVNGNSLVGSGNVDIDALPSQTGQGGKFLTTNGTTASWAEASVTPDNKSINKNNSNALQTIGVINQNDTTTALKVWHGTQDEYDALATHDANTRYYTDGGLSVSLLDVLYPVGSIYITTNVACPLSTLIAGSTWVQETSRVLVEKKEPTDSDPTWCNLYSDGWCEQGGYISRTSQSANDVVLSKEMADTNYTITATPKGQAAGGNYDFQWITYISVSTAGFTLTNGSLNGNVPASGMSWEVKGYTSTTTSHKQFRRIA